MYQQAHTCSHLAMQVNASSKFFGLAIVFTAGACYSIFSPAFNLSTNDQWHKLAPGVDHLVVYTAFFYFSLAFFACAVIINVCFLYKPAFGVPKSSVSGYLRDWNGRWIALLAGILCGWGNGFQFMGGQAAGYAAADAVQVRKFPCLEHIWSVLLARCLCHALDAWRMPSHMPANGTFAQS